MRIISRRSVILGLMLIVACGCARKSSDGAGADRCFLRSAWSRRDWLAGGTAEQFRCAKSQTLKYKRLRQPAKGGDHHDPRRSFDTG